MRVSFVSFALLLACPMLSMAFLLSSVSPVSVQHLRSFRPSTVRRANNALAAASMTYDKSPDLSPELLSLLEEAADLAAPLVAGAKVLEKLAEIDWDELDPETLEDFFTEETLEREFQPIFNNLRDLKTRTPDCVPTENGYLINIEAPGVKKEDLKVELVGKKTLIVSSGMKAAARNDDGDADEGMGTKASCFRLLKEVSIPSDADTSKMALNYKDGLLTVDIPRIEKNNEAVEDDSFAVKDAKSTTTKTAKLAEMEKEAEQLLAKLEQLRGELEIEQTKAEEREAEEKAVQDRQGATERIELDLR